MQKGTPVFDPRIARAVELVRTGQSVEAQQYAWVKEYEPELYARLREAAGVLWTEPEGGIASGEALVRQLWYGMNFFREEFGTEAKEAFLRGYLSAALPQILHGAGLVSLLGDRSSGFPHEHFLWEGIDGTRLPTHLSESMEANLPVWVGELESLPYDCTGRARRKKGNRKSEILLREAEFFDAVAGRSNYEIKPGVVEDHRAVHDVIGRGATTAAGYLERAWKLMLLNQGRGESSPDGASDYAAIFQLARGVAEPARRAVAAGIDTSSAVQPGLVFNCSPFARSEVVSLPDGSPIHVTAPACGYAVIDADAQRPVASFAHPLEVLERQRLVAFDNGMLRLIIDRATGNIRSLRDHRHHREVLAPGHAGNLFQWRGEEVRGVESIEVVEQSPLRAVVRIERKFGRSTIIQHISMRAASPRIDFDTEIEWQEEEGCLRVSFPVEVHAARASYEIAYGNVERPTHRKPHWNEADCEVCAQKWADLSEGDYGVALLNDGKYGYDIHGNVMRLNLLRAGEGTDEEDRGAHQFVYALLPHGGDFRDGCVIEQSYALNMPLHVTQAEKSGGTGPARRSFFQVDRDGLVIEAVKHAEREEAIVVRMYEAYGTRGSARLATTLPVRRAVRADLQERAGEEVDCRNGQVLFTVRPYEIVTFLLYLGEG